MPAVEVNDVTPLRRAEPPCTLALLGGRFIVYRTKIDVTSRFRILHERAKLATFAGSNYRPTDGTKEYLLQGRSQNFCWGEV